MFIPLSISFPFASHRRHKWSSLLYSGLFAFRSLLMLLLTSLGQRGDLYSVQHHLYGALRVPQTLIVVALISSLTSFALCLDDSPVVAIQPNGDVDSIARRLDFHNINISPTSLYIYAIKYQRITIQLCYSDSNCTTSHDQLFLFVNCSFDKGFPNRNTCCRYSWTMSGNSDACFWI